MSTLITIDTTIEVASGKKKEKFSRSTEKSPGNRPKGSLESHGHAMPATSSTRPLPASARPRTNRSSA